VGYYPRVKACVSCGKNLPDAAIICVFCRARQHEERLDPTPVKGIRHDVSPSQAVAEAETIGSSPKSGHQAATAQPRADRRTDGTAAAGPAAATPAVPRPTAEFEDRSMLIRFGQWNRNERATLTIAGLLTLGVVIGYERTALLMVLALAIAVAGIAPLPRVLRGAIALGAGFVLLWKMFGPAAAGCLVLLPGALLARAKNPASRLAQLWGLIAAAAFVAAYLIPRGDQTLYRTILDDFRGEHFEQIATGAWLMVPLPLAAVGLVALAPKRTVGGCVLWATLMLLWAPIGFLLLGFWTNTFGSSLVAAVVSLGAQVAASLGVADISA
jgi:hypothetical protein